MYPQLKRSSASGFSFIELLLVVLLVSMAFIIFLGALSSNKQVNAQTRTNTIQAIMLNDIQEQIRSRRFDHLTNGALSNNLGPDQIDGYMLDFDGSNDYVNLPDFSYLNDFSFSVWFKIDSRNTWERIFDFGRGGSGDIFLTTMGGRTGGDLELTIHPFGGTYTIDPGMTCDDGQWHHVVFTYDKGGAGMVLYIDGQNKGSNSYNTHSFSDFGSGQNFYLGKANWNDPYYDGKMEQVGLYDKALSSNEVTVIYNGGSNFDLNTNSGNYISETHLIGYWKMNEGSGNTVHDISGNGNHGTINGATWASNNFLEEGIISDFNDIDDFDGYEMTQIDGHPGFNLFVEVDYVDPSSKFRSVLSSPTNYKRVITRVGNDADADLLDTLIFGSGL